MLSANGYRSGLLTDTGKVYLWGRSAQLTNGEEEDFEPPFYILSPTLVPHIRFSNNDIIKNHLMRVKRKLFRCVLDFIILELLLTWDTYICGGITSLGNWVT